MVYAFYQVSASDSLTQTSKRLRRQVNQLEIQWKPIEELQNPDIEVSGRQENALRVQQRRLSAHRTPDLLTMITPEDTWLNYLSCARDRSSYGARASPRSKYLSELSKTEGLTDVKFASPVTRNPTSDMERFNVQLQPRYGKAEEKP